jgi:hypothetical protein
MKKFSLIISLLAPFFLIAQPAEFEMPCGTQSFNQLNRFVTINSFAAEPGQDWAAVIDSDGLTVARSMITTLSGFQGCPDAPAISMNVFRAPSGFSICPAGYGLNNGETFKVTVWDQSTGIFYELPETITAPADNLNYSSPAGGNCQVQDAADQSVFPVTFSSLQARDLGGKVSIDWSTASESGNEYFEVEHSDRLANFQSVGRINGAGDSQELLSYNLIHAAPVAGTNYYRIKQVDFEGTFTYSGIVPVDVAIAQNEAVSIFPNPAITGYFNLNVGSDWNVENVNVSLVNVVGRRVMEWNQDITATRQVTTSDLAAGLYLIRVEGGKRVTTQRLIVK